MPSAGITARSRASGLPFFNVSCPAAQVRGAQKQTYQCSYRPCGVNCHSSLTVCVAMMTYEVDETTSRWQTWDDFYILKGVDAFDSTKHNVVR